MSGPPTKACQPICDRHHEDYVGHHAANALKRRLQGACAPVVPALHGGTRRRVAAGTKRPQGRARRSRVRAAGPSVTGSRSPSFGSRGSNHPLSASHPGCRRTAHDEVGGFRRQRCRLKDCAAIRSEDAQPRSEIVSMTHRRSDAEFSAQERRTQLGNELFTRIGITSTPAGEIAIEASAMTRPMTLMPISA